MYIKYHIYIKHSIYLDSILYPAIDGIELANDKSITHYKKQSK